MIRIEAIIGSLVVLILIFIQVSCGNGGDSAFVFPQICFNGLDDLFAQDLSGTCRHNPPTPGALEAVNDA